MKLRMKRMFCGAAGLAALAGCAALGGEWRKSQEQKEFEAALGKTSFTVFPAVVRIGRVTQHDAATAREIAARLSARGLGEAVASAEPVEFATRGSFNQARMYQRSHAAFNDYIRTHPVATEYALLPEYLLSTKGGVGGVHLYVVRRDGAGAGGILLNSHWKEFRAVEPRSVNDATKALLLRIETAWKPGGPRP
jgi:hypothetical protein